MSNYQNGSAFERRVAAILERHGYYVSRSAGSHGVADLVAIKAWQILLVQCKGGKGTIPLPEWNRLYAVASLLWPIPGLEYGYAIPLLVTRDHIGRITWTQITGIAEARRPRPSAPWSPDPIDADYAMAAP